MRTYFVTYRLTAYKDDKGVWVKPSKEVRTVKTVKAETKQEAHVLTIADVDNPQEIWKHVKTV